MPDFSILLEGFSRGKRPLPIKGSYFASVGLSPFIKKGKLTSEYFLSSENGAPSELTSLSTIDDFAKTAISGEGGTLMVKSAANFYKEASGVWTGVHTCSLAHTAEHLGMAIEPHYGYLHWCSNEAVGQFTGTAWTDSWKTGLTNTYHYMLSIRNYMLVSNGRYIAGWSTENGSDWSTALLDLQPGYSSKRMVARKSAGTRQALIQGQYDTDRTKDGIFIWDLSSDAPIDFIPVPWMQDLFIENDIVYVIHGNQFDISQVAGTQLAYLNSVFDNPLLRYTTSYPLSASFLGKFSNLILINVQGVRETGVTTDNFYPGVWAYNTENNALFYWLPPSTGNIYNVAIGGIFVDAQDLWVASRSIDETAITYRIDKLFRTISTTQTNREIYVSPILDAGSIKTKIWKKIKSAHNMLLTTARILFKYRDFSRSLVTYQRGISAVGNNSFTFAAAAANAEVGDEVTVIAGTGSGQVRHITGIDATAKIFTIDENWDTNPVVSYSIVEIASWKKMSETSAITNKEKDGRILIFTQKGINTQIKLALEHPKDQTIELNALKITGEEQNE